MIGNPQTGTRPGQPVVTRLADLVDWLGTLTPVRGDGDLDVAVTGISLSTQRILPGDLYAALPGTRAHGADFADQALAAGAVAVLTDADGADRLPPGTPVLVVEHPRAVLGRVAAHLYGEPTADLTVIGVTGTQGKTTTTRLLEAGLEQAGVPAAVVGTVGTRIHGVDVKTSLTTPEAPDLHGLFAVMREQGVVACAMEVSSHALVLGRVDGVVFDVATFLNLGRDHLDFHPDVEDYFAAKASLFTPERARLGLTNVDDEHGRLLLDRAGIPMQTFSSEGRDADWRAVDVELAGDGARFTVTGPDGLRVDAGVPVPGAFNVSNALAAIASAALAGLDPAPGRARASRPAGECRAGWSGSTPARTSPWSSTTPTSPTRSRPCSPPCVRSPRGRSSSSSAPVATATPASGRSWARSPPVSPTSSSSPTTTRAPRTRPRSGPPSSPAPAGERPRCVEIGDRRAAIRDAVRRARPGDVVLIAGKGHETGQEVHGEVHPFDDRVVAAEEIAQARR